MEQKIEFLTKTLAKLNEDIDTYQKALESSKKNKNARTFIGKTEITCDSLDFVCKSLTATLRSFQVSLRKINRMK